MTIPSFTLATVDLANGTHSAFRSLASLLNPVGYPCAHDGASQHEEESRGRDSLRDSLSASAAAPQRPIAKLLGSGTAN